MNREYCKLTTAIKLTKYTLNKHLNSEELENLNKKLQIENAVFFYQLASKFNLSDINITAFRHIECCFSMIAETESFLELDFLTVSKILASFSLQIDSEVEVYSAADNWLNRNIEERSRFAKQLLLKARLNLLSKQTLEYLLSQSSCISKNDDCVELLKNKKEFFHQNESSVRNKSRQCNHNVFNVLICGGYDTKEKKITNQVKEFDRRNFKNLPPMSENRNNSKAVYIRGEVYVFGGFNKDGFITSVEKYSPGFKKWAKVTTIPDKRQNFCTCAFMNSIYLFGGTYLGPGYLKFCLRLDAKSLSWKNVAKMNVEKAFAACATYEGNIVVSGGRGNNLNVLNAVESYNVFAETWASMPSMISSRTGHSLVSVKSKLLAIGGLSNTQSCEIFDKTSSVFVTLEAPNCLSRMIVGTALIGNTVLVFQSETKVVLCFNVDNNLWSEESCEATGSICGYSSIKAFFQ